MYNMCGANLHLPSFHTADFILLQRVTTYIMLIVMQHCENALIQLLYGFRVWMA